MSQHNVQLEVTKEQLDPYYARVYQQADEIVRYFMIGFFIVGVILSFFYDTYLLAFVMGGISLGSFFIIQGLMPQSQFFRYATSFLFWNFGVQYLLQMKGQYEMHFFFFIALTVLLFYEDWRLLIPATVYTIVTVTVFYVYRDSRFFESFPAAFKEAAISSFIIHLTITLFYAGLCLRWSIMQRDQTRESALRAIMMEQQLTMMDTNIAFADSISQGNLQAEYPSANTDRLGQSLLNMRQSLAEAKVREEREKFSTAGLATIGEILRQHADSLDLLCDRVIEEVVKYMKANQGNIFMLEDRGTPQEHLKLMACRAWDRKKYLQKTVALGEGLIGQAAIEKQTIFMTKVPNNYVIISSGLGEANPSCILIVPLKFEEEVVGVIELASFKAFRDYEVTFLEKVGESIASTMITTQNNQRNKELLEKSNLLAEQMRSQEEEIRQNMEEMQATQEEMGRKEKEIKRLLDDSLQNEDLLKEKIREINQMKEIDQQKTEKMLEELEYNKSVMGQVIEQLPEKIFLKDENGKMLMLNSAIAAGYNKPISELIGKSDFDLFPKELAMEFRKVEEQMIASGKPLTVEEEFPTANGEVRNLYTVKMPFKFPRTGKVGILGYQVDITDIKRLEKKVKEAEELARKNAQQ